MVHDKRLLEDIEEQLTKSDEELLEENAEEPMGNEKKGEIDKEKQESIDAIFTRDYDNSVQLVRRMIRTDDR